MKQAVVALLLTAAPAAAEEEAMFPDTELARPALATLAPRMNAADPKSCRDAAGVVEKAAKAVADAETALGEKKSAIDAVLKRDKDNAANDGPLAKAVKDKKEAVDAVLQADAGMTTTLNAYIQAQGLYRQKIAAHYAKELDYVKAKALYDIAIAKKDAATTDYLAANALKGTLTTEAGNAQSRLNDAKVFTATVQPGGQPDNAWTAYTKQKQLTATKQGDYDTADSNFQKFSVELVQRNNVQNVYLNAKYVKEAVDALNARSPKGKQTLINEQIPHTTDGLTADNKSVAERLAVVQTYEFVPPITTGVQGHTQAQARGSEYTTLFGANGNGSGQTVPAANFFIKREAVDTKMAAMAEAYDQFVLKMSKFYYKAESNTWNTADLNREVTGVSKLDEVGTYSGVPADDAAYRWVERDKNCLDLVNLQKWSPVADSQLTNGGNSLSKERCLSFCNKQSVNGFFDLSANSKANTLGYGGTGFDPILTKLAAGQDLDPATDYSIVYNACMGINWHPEGITDQKCKIGVWGQKNVDLKIAYDTVSPRSGTSVCIINQQVEPAIAAFGKLQAYMTARTALITATTGDLDVSAAILIPGSPDPAWGTYLTNYKTAMKDWHGNLIQEEVARARTTEWTQWTTKAGTDFNTAETNWNTPNNAQKDGTSLGQTETLRTQAQAALDTQKGLEGVAKAAYEALKADQKAWEEAKEQADKRLQDQTTIVSGISSDQGNLDLEINGDPSAAADSDANKGLLKIKNDLWALIGEEASPEDSTTRKEMNVAATGVSTALANLMGGGLSARQALLDTVAEKEKVVAAFWWDVDANGVPEKTTDDPPQLKVGGTFGAKLTELKSAWGAVQQKETELRTERQKCKEAEYDTFRISLAQAAASRLGTLQAIKRITPDPVVARGATGGRCEKPLTNGDFVRRGACKELSDCCGAARGTAPNGATMTIEVCQNRKVAGTGAPTTTYLYRPPRAPLATTLPDKVEWPWACIDGARQLAGAAAALLASAYMMA